jgi:hypothetical protein
MVEKYHNNPAIIAKSADLLRSTTPAAPMNLRVSGVTSEIIRQEAYYCRAPEEEMPYRIVLHGAAITALAKEGATLGFDVGRKSLLPFTHPLPSGGNVQASLDHTGQSRTENATVELSPIAAGMLADTCEEYGFSMEHNFAALAGLINYIGISEREGLALVVRNACLI